MIGVFPNFTSFLYFVSERSAIMVEALHARRQVEVVIFVQLELVTAVLHRGRLLRRQPDAVVEGDHGGGLEVGLGKQALAGHRDQALVDKHEQILVRVRYQWRLRNAGAGGQVVAERRSLKINNCRKKS